MFFLTFWFLSWETSLILWPREEGQISAWVFIHKHSWFTGHQGMSCEWLPPISHTRRHQLGNCCRELTSAHSQQSDWNCEPLVSNCKSLTSFNFKVSFFMYAFSGALYDNRFTDMAFLKERFTKSIYTSCCDIANIVFLQTSHIRVSMLQLFC